MSISKRRNDSRSQSLPNHGYLDMPIVELHSESVNALPVRMGFDECLD